MRNVWRSLVRESRDYRQRADMEIWKPRKKIRRCAICKYPILKGQRMYYRSVRVIPGWDGKLGIGGQKVKQTQRDVAHYYSSDCSERTMNGSPAYRSLILQQWGKVRM